ncbi:MAG: MFS transporter [Verrucomicrobia bacterium]|nr:MFS transporter [Verrucomicrobiota bacterium]
MKTPSLLIIFLTVFIDLIGFGIVLPLLPVYSENFGASGFTVGVIMASFSAMQFLFAPLWGRWSDKVGRRPVLLISNAGSAISYALFAVASGLKGDMGLWMLLASRIFAGICGANISVAQAYIADITPPADRSRRMGLIGMAFGLGFILGPALGGLSLAGFDVLGIKFNGFGLTGPGWVAAALCAGNFLLTLAILPESRKPDGEPAPQRPRFEQWSHTLTRPQVGLLVWLFFLATFAFTCFETTLGLLVSDTFKLDIHKPDDAKKIGYLFAYCGLIGAFVQGGAIGRAVKKLGEPKLIAISLLFTAASLAPLPFVRSWGALLAVLALLAIGSSLARPPIFGLISILTPANEQGATIGVAQSFGSLARIAGPIFAGSLFHFHPSWPYLVCAGVSLLAGLLAWQKLKSAAHAG